MDGARAAFFRTSRRFSCFFAFANFQGDIAWMTLVRTSFIFFRAGLGRSVKHSTSGGRDIVIWDGFRILTGKPACNPSKLRWLSSSSPDRCSRAPWA